MRRRQPICLGVVILWAVLSSSLTAKELARIAVAKDRKGFVEVETGAAFVPWGFNYDHDEQGRLLEDYWEMEWDKVESDFREMRRLGANVARVHLQLGKFMQAADQPNPQALDRLGRLVALAGEVGLYLNLTGLGCYHKQDVPDWYAALEERPRWETQARFWEAVARRCAESPAIFCYDLMNEPVVPGGEGQRDDWLGPSFAGKHFVQFIALQTDGRARPEIARRWIAQLVAAIRAHDSHHLITVGLVPWSLDRPGLTSGFVPSEIDDQLDFLSVHIYPESGKLDEALETLRGFDVGKPVVIEEIFPLKCTAAELDKFIPKSRVTASGWIGFYWGRTPEQYREDEDLKAALMRAWLELFQRHAPPR